jgi:hypothetical protein
MSNKLLYSKYLDKEHYNKLMVNDLNVDNKNYNRDFLNTKIPNLEYVGINMKPCEHCKKNNGVHYHNINLDSKSIGDNWKDDKHMCKLCKDNQGKLHIHTNTK